MSHCGSARVLPIRTGPFKLGAFGTVLQTASVFTVPVFGDSPLKRTPVLGVGYVYDCPVSTSGYCFTI